MKTVLVVLVCLLVACAVDAKSKVAERLKTAEGTTTTTTTTTTTDTAAKQDTTSVAATQLSGSPSSDCSCSGSGSSDSSSSCGGCGSNVNYVSSVGGGGGDFGSWKDMQERQMQNMGPRPRVEDAVRPIDDWLNDFTKRTQLHGGLWESARATVQPLLKRLERTQHEAIERLIESNRAIRDHVEDAATQHIYNLLKSKRALDDAELAAEQKKEKVKEANALIKHASEFKKEAQEGAKQMQENYKKEKEMESKNNPGGKKGNTTDTIMSHISKILAEK